MIISPPMTDNVLNFGENYAILQLDWMTILIDAIKETAEGRKFVSNCSRWNEAVHNKSRRPLTIFSTLCFDAGQAQLAPDAPFTRLLKPFGSFTKGSPEVQIASEFEVDERDIILQKTRWYAGSGNTLQQILSAQSIDTVIITGLSLSGVVMSTIYQLFDLDYQIYVIADAVLELPPSQTSEVAMIMLENILPKMNCKAISLDQALEALSQS